MLADKMKSLPSLILIFFISLSAFSEDQIDKYDKQKLDALILVNDQVIRGNRDKLLTPSNEQSLEYGKFIGYYDAFKTIKFELDKAPSPDLKESLRVAASSISVIMIKRVKYNFTEIIPVTDLISIVASLNGGFVGL